MGYFKTIDIERQELERGDFVPAEYDENGKVVEYEIPDDLDAIFDKDKPVDGSIRFAGYWDEAVKRHEEDILHFEDNVDFPFDPYADPAYNGSE